MLINSILLVVSIIIPVIALLIQPILTREILRDLRFVRILHYIALAFFGFSLYFSHNDHDVATFFAQTNQLLLFPLLIIALVYSAVFAIITNNIADLETDKISNSNRPLVKQTIKQVPYLIAGIFCLGYALLLSVLVHPAIFFSILIISLLYYLYSCKPFRLKRIPVIAKLLIGFNSLVVAAGGFMLAGGKLADFPVAWALFIALPLSLAANFVDLKDIKGDSHTGIKTLPVLLGEKASIHLIVFFTVCTYVTASCIINIAWVYPLCLLMLVIHTYLLYRKPYNEKPVFIIYISALFGLNIILLLNKYLV